MRRADREVGEPHALCVYHDDRAEPRPYFVHYFKAYTRGESERWLASLTTAAGAPMFVAELARASARRRSAQAAAAELVTFGVRAEELMEQRRTEAKAAEKQTREAQHKAALLRAKLYTLGKQRGVGGSVAAFVPALPAPGPIITSPRSSGGSAVPAGRTLLAREPAPTLRSAGSFRRDAQELAQVRLTAARVAEEADQPQTPGPRRRVAFGSPLSDADEPQASSSSGGGGSAPAKLPRRTSTQAPQPAPDGATIPYPLVVRWARASKRSTPGPDNCVDMQVRADDGSGREMRLKFAAVPEAAAFEAALLKAVAGEAPPAEWSAGAPVHIVKGSDAGTPCSVRLDRDGLRFAVGEQAHAGAMRRWGSQGGRAAVAVAPAPAAPEPPADKTNLPPPAPSPPKPAVPPPPPAPAAQPTPAAPKPPPPAPKAPPKPPAAAAPMPKPPAPARPAKAPEPMPPPPPPPAPAHAAEAPKPMPRPPPPPATVSAPPPPAAPKPLSPTPPPPPPAAKAPTKAQATQPAPAPTPVSDAAALGQGLPTYPLPPGSSRPSALTVVASNASCTRPVVVYAGESDVDTACLGEVHVGPEDAIADLRLKIVAELGVCYDFILSFNGTPCDPQYDYDKCSDYLEDAPGLAEDQCIIAPVVQHGGHPSEVAMRQIGF